TTLYLYYDSTHTTNSGYIGDTGETPAQSVWDDNFKAVYHLGQNPSGGITDAIIDSTDNVSHMTSAGSMTSADLVDGKIGKAIDFDGGDDNLVSTATDFTFSGDFWISCIAKIDTGSTNDLVLKSVTNHDWNSATNGDYCFIIGGDLRPIFYIKGSTGNAGGGGTVISQDTYYQYDAIKIGNTITLYIDGVQSGNTSTYAGTVGNNNSLRVAYSQTNLTAGYFDGIVDEVRVMDVERAWSTRSGPGTSRVSYLSGTSSIVVECLVPAP
ncbi:hypothetical protein LCGC14_2756610, partial [marine sediment metagenome]